MTTARAPQAGGSAGSGSGFRRWRRTRPFWGGLLLVLSGIELLLSSNMDLGALAVHFGPTGFLSYVIPAMLILCGAMTWATPNLRLFYGILGSLVAVYSLIGLNFGGFFIGLLLGIVGGALCIAWSPVGSPRGTGPAVVPQAEPPALVDPMAAAGPPAQLDPEPSGEWIPRQYGDPRDAETQRFPAVDDESSGWFIDEHGEERRYRGGEPPPPRDGGGGHRSRLYAITLVPVTLAAVALMAVDGPRAAYAAPCPTPSSSTAPAKPGDGVKSSSPPAAKPGAPLPGSKPDPAKKPDAAPSESASPEPAQTGSGNAFVDGWNNFVGGVKRLFGGDKEQNDPQPTPSTSASPGAPDPTRGPGGGGPTTPPKPGQPQQPAAPSGSAQPSTSAVPCLGPGIVKNAAVDPGQPLAAATPATLTIQTLTMFNSTYDGVAELPTAKGKVRALQFSMTSNVSTPFELRVREPNGKTTQITSSKLVSEGHVKFFTTKFSGRLLGFPVTFTPEQPPPLTLPILIFTNVTIDLVFTSSDTLTADNLTITQI